MIVCDYFVQLRILPKCATVSATHAADRSKKTNAPVVSRTPIKCLLSSFSLRSVVPRHRHCGLNEFWRGLWNVVCSSKLHSNFRGWFQFLNSSMQIQFCSAFNSSLFLAPFIFQQLYFCSSVMKT